MTMRLRKDNGFLSCTKDLINKNKYRLFTKGKKYDVECIGFLDMAVEIATLSDDLTIYTFVLWGDDGEKFENHFDWVGEYEPDNGELMIGGMTKV